MRPAGTPIVWESLASSGRRVSTQQPRPLVGGLLVDRAPAGSPVTGLLMGCRARFGVSTCSLGCRCRRVLCSVSGEREGVAAGVAFHRGRLG